MRGKDYVKIIEQENTSKVDRVINRIKDTTLQSEIIKWKKHLQSKSNGKTTPTYMHLTAQFFESINKPVDKVKPSDIDNYLGKIRQKGNYSKASMTYSALLNLYRYRHGLSRKENPPEFKGLDNVKKKPKKKVALDFESEIKPMLASLSDSPRNESALHVLYEAMLRKTELLSLRVCDIDLTQKPAPVNVRRSKTEAGVQRPTFIYNAIPILKKWLNIHPLREHPNFNEAPLFVTSKGKPMKEGTIREIIKMAGDRAEVKKEVFPHLFRSSRAYELARVYHFQPQELMKAGGWSNSSMLDVYYNPNDDDIKDRILSGHGVKTITQEEREDALKKRQIRLCPCGCENGFDAIFCDACGVILNIKQYKKEIKSKESEIDVLKGEILGIKEMLKQMALNGQIKKEK